MEPLKKRSRTKKLQVGIAALLVVVLVLLSLFANQWIEPILRDRLHTLIVKGSDSLYQYKLGKLKANLFGGAVEVENLQIQINDAHYQQLAAQHALPSLTMELNLVKGKLNGLRVLPLLFGRQISLREIYSKDADVVLLRHIRHDDAPENTQPLWKAIQPVISSIAIDRIHLDGVKLLYRNADTSRSVKLQFDRCVARFNDIKIDSAAAADTARLVFARDIDMQFYDLKFRSPDSTYKLKAEVISYASATKAFEVTDFKIQPTLQDTASFYAAAQRQETMYVFTFEKAKFTNLHLDRFIHRNILSADTLYIQKPVLHAYKDRTYPPLFESKVGAYPHQHLLKAASTIMLKGLVVNGATVHYTERGEKSGEEGALHFTDMNLRAANITNDSNWIKKNGKSSLWATGNIFNTSPFDVKIDFYLDSANGRFDASGTVGRVTAAQLNTVSEPLANAKLESFNMQGLSFAVRANDYEAFSNVQMQYNNLFVTLKKQDDETGVTSTKKFLTKILNKFTLHQSNPGENGVVRQGINVRRSRLTSQAFFGVLWKSIFSGMQAVMMKTGRFD